MSEQVGSCIYRVMRFQVFQFVLQTKTKTVWLSGDTAPNFRERPGDCSATRLGSKQSLHYRFDCPMNSELMADNPHA